MRLKSYFISLAIIAASASFTASALSADFFPSSSVLSSGHWVKIKVEETGIQQITYDQLRQWGFTDPSKVTIYGFGAAMSSRDIIDDTLGGDLPQQPVVRTDDKLLFFGESNARTGFLYQGTSTQCSAISIRNSAADAGYYFLTDSYDEQAATTLPFVDSDDTAISYHIYTTFSEEEATSPNSAGMHYYGHDLGADEVLSFSFPMPDRYFSSSLGNYVYINPILVGSGSSNKFAFTVPVTRSTGNIIFSGSKTTPSLSDATTLYTTTEYYPLSYPMDEEITQLDFTVQRYNSSYDDFAALDLFAFYYPRRNRYDGSGEMILSYFDLASDSRITLSEANPNLLIWNADYASAIKPFETVYDADEETISFTPNATYKTADDNDYCARFVVFDPTMEHRSVEYVGEVDNQDLHAISTPDMLIISSEVCYEQALRLAQIHREMLGHDVTVVKQAEIFNEFGSGAESPYAYRYFAKMLYDRDPSKLKHILLFGGGSFDNRGLLDVSKYNKSAGALLMTYGTTSRTYAGTTSKSFTSDAYFGFLADSFKPGNIYTAQMLVNVGRIPAIDASTATSCVDKIESYLSSIPASGANNRVYLFSDAGNSDSFTNGSETISQEMSNVYDGFTFIKGYSAIYEWTNSTVPLLNNAVAQALKAGVGYFTYQGHGASTSLSSQKLMDISSVNATDYDSYPFAMMATCDIYNFDRTDNNLAESMVFKRNGGMIGVIAASRSVYEARNKILNNAVATQYAKADDSTTTGDLYRIARNEVVATSAQVDVAVNTLCYNFCGDPALPIFAADNNLTIETINGTDINSEELIPITGLAQNSLVGYISNNGEVDTSFNGSVILTLYEAPVTKTTHTNGSGDSQQNIVMDEDALVQASAQVTNGRFTVNFTPPAQTREGDYNRITLYAIADDQRHFSKAYTDNAIMRFDEQAEDTSDEAPEITALYLDSPSFVEGDEVDGSFRLYATVNPGQSGIKTATSSIGGITQVNIDGSSIIPVLGSAISYQVDGTIEISLPISDVEDGSHELTLTTTNNIGNSASRSLAFFVINRPATASLSVEESPARTVATIGLTHTFSSAPTGRIIVEDNAGNTVFTATDASFPYQWDLTDTDGALVADGIYQVYAILNSGHQYASTDKLQIIVVQKQ